MRESSLTANIHNGNTAHYIRLTRFWEQGVVGSNPATPTSNKSLSESSGRLFCVLSQTARFWPFSARFTRFLPVCVNQCVNRDLHDESYRRGCLLQIQAAQKRHISFDASSYKRPQTQIRFARPFPARKVLGFRERQAQTQLPGQGANRNG